MLIAYYYDKKKSLKGAGKSLSVTNSQSSRFKSKRSFNHDRRKGLLTVSLFNTNLKSHKTRLEPTIIMDYKTHTSAVYPQ